MLPLLPEATIGLKAMSKPYFFASCSRKAATSDSVLKSLKLFIAFCSILLA